MIILATTGMGTKIVAALDENQNIIETSRYCDFSGGNKNSKGSMKRIDLTNSIEVEGTFCTNDLTKYVIGDRVFVNANTTVKSSGKGFLPGNCLSEVLMDTAKHGIVTVQNVKTKETREIRFSQFSFLIVKK